MYGHVHRDVLDIHADMQEAMRMDRHMDSLHMCIGVCVDVYANTCVDVRIQTCVYTCVQTCFVPRCLRV